MTQTIRITQIPEKGVGPTLASVPLPTPRDGEVVVRMHAAALNFADLLMVQGSYQDTPAYPFVPGMEGAGEVVAVGAGVSLPVGCRVAVAGMGTLAEAGAFAEDACTPIPASMSYRQAAGFQIAYGTSHLALTHRGGLRAGETLVVLGAAGGVGLTAVEIGAALGARVIAVARGADKAGLLRDAGAAEVIDSATTEDLRATLRELGGADLVYDPVGDAPGLAAFGSLNRGGRHLVIGFAAGRPPALPLNHALVKNITIHGIYWGGYRSLDPQTMRATMAALFEMCEAGRLHPHVGTTLPLSRVAEGYALLRDRKVTGKLIIDTRPEEEERAAAG